MEQFWASPIRDNAVAGFRFYLADETGTALTGTCGVRPSPWAQPARSILTRDGYFGASHGEWRHQRRRSVAICELRAGTRGHSESRPVHDKRIEKTVASANPQVQAKPEALKELFAAFPAMAQGGQPSTDVMTK